MDYIIKKIITYLNSPKTEGAFHVKGEWGSGKTYFFKEILPGKIKEQVNRTQVMISLFGMEGVKDIPFRLLNAYVNIISGQQGNISEHMNRGLDYLDMKYGVDRKLFEMNLHDEDELIYNIIPTNEVYLCFDDVERFVTEDNVGEIMGTINNLVENIGYKVIVISNDHYHNKDDKSDVVRSQFKEKVIGGAVTFIPAIMDIYKNVVDKYQDKEFSAFMQCKDISELFLPQKRHHLYRKDFENIRNIKFAISNFYVVFDHYRDSASSSQTIKSLKCYLAFIIGVSIEYKKDILTDFDCHGIDVYTDVFSLNFDDDGSSENEVSELFNDMENTLDEKEKLKKEENFNAIYRKRFYKVYAKDVNQASVFHEELYNNITKGYPIDFEKLEDNIKTKVYDKERKENPGNAVVSQTLDETIFNDSDEVIKSKMLNLLSTVEDGSLVFCTAYVNAFSFLDMYRSVIGKTHDELLEIFKVGFSKYLSSHEIDDIMERANMEMVSQDIPSKTRAFYDFMQDEFSKKWKAEQNEEIEELITMFNTDIPKFCSMLTSNGRDVPYHHITGSVLQNIPEDSVVRRMLTLTPIDVHELTKFVPQRFTTQDIYSLRLQKEKDFLIAMKRGVESIDGDDSVSKVAAKTVLKFQVDKALSHFNV